MRGEPLTKKEFVGLLCGACTQKGICGRMTPDTSSDYGLTVKCFVPEKGAQDPMCLTCANNKAHGHAVKRCLPRFSYYDCWRRAKDAEDVPYVGPLDFTPRYECGIRKGGGK